MSELHLHPRVDHGNHSHAVAGFSGGTLKCKCPSDQVEVTVSSDYLFNHLCGCTQCWKPEGAIFSMLAAVPRDSVKVSAHEEKLKIVNPNALLHRYACTGCGVHMYGVIEKPDHVFHGFAFIHPEVSEQDGYQNPSFAAFVSSVIEGGFPPDQMDALRDRLRQLDIAPYDCYSPELMDIVATHAAKASGVLAA